MDSGVDKFQGCTDDMAYLTAERMRAYLEFRLQKGYSKKTVEPNRLHLRLLYDFLPDKRR